MKPVIVAGNLAKGTGLRCVGGKLEFSPSLELYSPLERGVRLEETCALQI
jgi:hypothetical protein